MMRGLDPIRRGFSLIELVMVLATMAVISAIAVPRYAGAIRDYRLQSAVRQVQTDIALAKSRANFASSSVTIAFDPSSNSYQIIGMPALDGRPGWYTVNLAADPYRVTLNNAVFGNGNQLIFDGYGMPAAGGSLVLGEGGLQKTITVDPATGSTTVQ